MRKFRATLSPTSTISAEEVQVPSMRHYMADLLARPPLTPEEEYNLFSRRAESGIRDCLIEANLRLVVAVAKMYQGRGMEMGDLIQEGNIGLMKSVDVYDHTRGNKFSTYALWNIHRQIFIAFHNQAGVISVPYTAFVRVRKRARVEKDLHHRLGRPPTQEEVFDEMLLSPEQFASMMDAKGATEVASLDEPIDSAHREGRPATLYDFLPAPVPEDSPFDAAQIAAVPKVLRWLTAGEEMVLRLRYRIGLAGEPMTLQAVADLVDLTKEGIRQTERRALESMRRILKPGGRIMPFAVRSREPMDTWLGRWCGQCDDVVPTDAMAFCSPACGRTWWRETVGSPKGRRKVSR